MRYFDIKLNKDITASITEEVGKGESKIKVVQVYPTQIATGLSAVRGKSLASAKQNANRLGLYGRVKKEGESNEPS